MDVNNEVEAVLNLQQIDLEIIKVNQQLEKIPLEIKLLENGRAELKNSLSNIDDAIKKARLDQKEMEKDIEVKKASIQKLEMQLNSVKKNEEYTALLHEIENAKKTIFTSENKIIEAMESVEKKEREKTSKVRENESREAEILKQIGEQKKIESELKAKNLDLENQRKTAALACKGSLYKKYQRFMEKKQTVALVVLEKNGACSGCHQNLPPHIRNEVMKGRITTCDNCARLLYWDKTPSPQETEGEAKS